MFMGFSFGSETWCFQCASGSDAPATRDFAIEYDYVPAYTSTPTTYANANKKIRGLTSKISTKQLSIRN